MDKITYTTILHSARENLGITTNEYCVADIIYHLSNNPKSNIHIAINSETIMLPINGLDFNFFE